MEPTTLEMAAGALSEYYDWLNAAPAGAVLIYWRGSLQADRQTKIPIDDVLRSDQRTTINCLNSVADRLFKDAKAGLVALHQKRLDEGLYEYRATRKRRNFPGPSAPLETLPNDHLVPV